MAFCRFPVSVGATDSHLEVLLRQSSTTAQQLSSVQGVDESTTPAPATRPPNLASRNAVELAFGSKKLFNERAFEFGKTGPST